ncbi:hypothetical protein BS47DRAFT_876126 [Hydnum rufescens UP504]|uniref:Uncharacterized protein n=1 Tax=Hydnum rufescens UP504 TaxID=1448309 RepID=A0A9P6DUR2_9AGAM|nr:hypothetical protein BS47DRAFT_876126 [Hydnum rufescens UP504]
MDLVSQEGFRGNFVVTRPLSMSMAVCPWLCVRPWLSVHGCPSMAVRPWLSVHGCPSMAVHLWLCVHGCVVISALYLKVLIISNMGHNKAEEELLVSPGSESSYSRGLP